MGNDPRGMTEALPIVQEYLRREKLAKLGYVSDMRTLSAWKADCFETIANKIAEVQAKKLKKSNKKGR